jgi:hypothetical protein
VLHQNFSSICNLLHVINDCYTFKIGPEVVLAARWRPTAEITSPFDSSTLILYWPSVKIFRLSLTIQKLFQCIDSAGNLAFRFQIWGLGAFARSVISYQRDPQKAPPFSQPRRLS